MLRTLFIAALIPLVVPATARAQKDDRIKRLEAGEIIVTSKKIKGASVPLLKATGLVKAPPAKVWAIIEKCADYHKNMPRTLKSEELSRKGNKVVCRVTIDMPFPLKDITETTTAIHTVKPGKLYKREWRHKEGDLRVNKGSWTLRPYNGGKHTVVTYKVLTVPKIEIPAAILRMAQKRTLPQVILNLRERLE